MTIRMVSALIAASLAASPSPVPAQGPGGLAKVAPPAGLLAPEAATTVAARLALLEGPAFDGRGNLVLRNRQGSISWLFSQPSG